MFVVLFSGCSNNQDVRTIRQAYTELKTGILQNDPDAVLRKAPFLKEASPETVSAVLARLKESVRDASISEIKMSDEKNAILVLKGREQIVLSFEKTTEGNWVLSDTLTRKKFIQIVPRQ